MLDGAAQTQICTAGLTSGTPADGVWGCSVTFPQGAATGTWTFSAHLWDETGNFNRETTSTTVTVSSTGGGDTAPPNVVSSSATPGAVDVSSSSVTVALSARVTDSETGTRSVHLMLDGAAQTQICTAGLTSGTPADGVWGCSVTFPQGAATGTWTFSAHLWDETGNFNRETTSTTVTVSSTGG